MNFLKKCHERCCARPNHLWGHPKCSLGGPGPHLSGPILLWCRPGRGKPLFWPLGAGIPQQAKTKVAKKAPNLNQRRGWLGGIPKGAWEPRGPWAEPALALGNPLTHNQDKKSSLIQPTKSPQGHPAKLLWSYWPVLCLFSPATDPFETPKHRIPIGHQQGTPPQAGVQKVH